MAKTKISDFVISFIEQLGVDCVFLVSGSASIYLLDSLAKSKKMKYVCNHHEQASAIAAEVYARESENIGVCIVTTGPGATNAITGLISAWLDSVPVLFISAQVKRDVMIKNSKLRQIGIQEINIIDIVKPITKYSVTITDPEEVRYHFEKAVFLARSGRPGPVWIDLPLDIHEVAVEKSQLKKFNPVKENLVFREKRSLGGQIASLLRLIKKSQRPVLLAGRGIQLGKGRHDFLKMAEVLKIPVLTSMSAHDLMVFDHPLLCGRPGVFGDRAGNFAVQNADLLISIGARLHLWNIGYNYKTFAREAIKVVVDIDEAELKKPTIKVDLPIRADAREFIEEVNRRVKNAELPDFSNWVKRCMDWKKKYPIVLPEYKKEKKFVNSYYFIDALSSLLERGETIVTGNGTAFTCTNQAVKIKKDQRLHYNVGCATMGYDLPAAIGAYCASKKKRIIVITGDGSLMMNLQELQTIFHHKIPAKIFLLNNKCYLAVKNTQEMCLGGNWTASDPTSGVSFPDFEKIAAAFNILYEKIDNNAEVEKKIKKVLGCTGPVLCDINMSPDQPLYPVVPLVKKSGGVVVPNPLEEMYPPLPREEFLNNMIIKPIED